MPSLAFEKPATARGLPSPLPYVYILGAGHSGSTLLSLLLAMHPDVCTIGEVKASALGSLEEYRCSCGRSIDGCEFWRSLREEVELRGGSFDLAAGGTDIRRAPTPYLRMLLKPLHRSAAWERPRAAALALSPSWRTHLNRVQSLNVALAAAACTLAGKRVFVDSSKTGLQLKYLLANPELDLRIVRLVRDGRGVSLSYRSADGLSIADAAKGWRRSNEEAEIIVSQLPRDRWFDLRYETLCRELEPTLRALCTFIGVTPPGSLDRLQGPPQHILGNDKARLRPSEVRLDEKWRRVLTADDLVEFEQVAGPLNRRLGYA